MATARSKAAVRWRRRKEERPAEILAAALQCFAERGFAACRLDDVARRAGVSKGTLYLYFPSKEELFKAVVRQTIVPNIAVGEAAVAAAQAGAPALLAGLLERWAALAETPAAAIPKLVLAEAGNFPDLARFYREEVVDRGLGVIGRLLRSGIERGEFRPVDVDHVVFCIAGPIIMSMLWRQSLGRHDSHALDALAVCRAHLDLLTQGLAPPASAGRAERPRRGAAR